MTDSPDPARVIDGVAVLDDRDTRSPINDRAGNPVMWRKIRTLLMADGTTLYGCSVCDYTSRNPMSIRPHLGKHSGKVRVDTPTAEVSAIVAQLQRLAQTEQERDSWKTRALAAESELRKIRAAFGRVLG